MKKLCVLALLTLVVAHAYGNNGSLQNHVQASKAPSTASQDNSKNAVVPLKDIDLSKIGHITPKGRVQDKDYNELPIIDQLTANGKESIPFLISKLEDETKIKEHVMDYWYEIRVGDVAQIILNDFFLDYSWKKSTIPGVGWNEFLECKGQDLTSEQCLSNYVSKYGRKSIRAKWQRVWDENKERIYWDETDRSFRLKPS